MKWLNVLSLFDGMSCMQIALRELNIPVANYFASEVDKHAIAQTQLNFPNTVQLGDVRSVDVSKLPYIHVLAGGSPCQSFSFAGKRNGMTTKENVEIYTLEHYLQLKNDGFEFDGQSYLFWEYMRILKDIKAYNPGVLFLLENVEMGAKWERVLSEAIGIYGVHINSALVSAQNRKRIYWTNFRTKRVGLFGELHSDIPQPHDRGILLKDILEDDVDEKYYLTDNAIARLSNNDGDGFRSTIKNEVDKSSTILSTQHKLPRGIDLICVAMRGRNQDDPSDRTAGSTTQQRLELNLNGKTNCLTSVQKDNLVMQINPSTESGGKQPYQQNRVYDSDGISPALCANKADLLIKQNYAVISDGYEQDNRAYFEDGKSGTLDLKSESRQKVLLNDYRVRRLTPTECASLQTIPDWYKWGCSDTQAYRMLGNGWTIEVIKHILSFADFNNITQ
jgi:DNA (cytosine-5)-methyltransferase 3A